MIQGLTPHVGFPLSNLMQTKTTRFLEGVAAKDKKAGEYFYDVLIQLTEEIVDALLLKTVSIAQVSAMGQKAINLCATTSNKASSMLSAKIYKGAKQSELEQVANFWQGMLKNSETNQGGNWYLATPIEPDLARDLDSILAEKGDQPTFAPKNLEDTARKYDQMIGIIIEYFFLRPAQFVDMGMLTRKMLNLGVDGVKQAAHTVVHKVVKRLEPAPFGAYVDHTAQYYIRLP